MRAVFQPIYDLATGVPRGFEGLVRPLPDSGFADAGSMFEAAEATGRTGELDIACLNTVMETAARLRLPGSLTVNLSPRTMEMDDFSVHALLRMIVRHGLDPRHIVLELTEREAVEDVDRLRRAVEACRVAGIRLAADDVGAGNAGLRLLSQLRFDIVKIDLSLVQGGAVHDASLEIVGRCATWPTAGARWSSPKGSRPPASSTSSVRSGSGPGRATCSAARPIGRRPNRSTWTPCPGAPTGSSSACARCRHDRPPGSPAVRCCAVDGGPMPARLPPRRAIAVDDARGDRIEPGSVPADRRKVAVVVTSDGRRVHVPDRSCRCYPFSTFSSRFRGLTAFLG